MKFVMEGHEYSYNDDTQELKDNYGTVVASWEDDETGEYYYAEIIEPEIDFEPAPIHVNVIQDTPEARGLWLVQTYVASTY